MFPFWSGLLSHSGMGTQVIMLPMLLLVGPFFWSASFPRSTSNLVGISSSESDTMLITPSSESETKITFLALFVILFDFDVDGDMARLVCESGISNLIIFHDSILIQLPCVLDPCFDFWVRNSKSHVCDLKIVKTKLPHNVMMWLVAPQNLNGKVKGERRHDSSHVTSFWALHSMSAWSLHQSLKSKNGWMNESMFKLD